MQNEALLAQGVLHPQSLPLSWQNWEKMPIGSMAAWVSPAQLVLDAWRPTSGDPWGSPSVYLEDQGSLMGIPGY